MKGYRLLGVFLLVATLFCHTQVAKASYNTDGKVQFLPGSGSVSPVDPENPNGQKPHIPGNPPPGTSGPLSIDFVSKLDFGANKISNKDEIYYAKPQEFHLPKENGEVEVVHRPNYVQVSDRRGTNEGWILQVRKNGQLTAEKETKHPVLEGAEITIKDGVNVSASDTTPPRSYDITLDPNGTLHTVTEAKVGEGAMTWATYYGTVEEVEEELLNTSIQLFVPGQTPKDAVAYSTTLTWTLTTAVGNE